MSSQIPYWLTRDHVQPFWNEFRLGFVEGGKDPKWTTTQLALFGQSDRDESLWVKDLGDDHES